MKRFLAILTIVLVAAGAIAAAIAYGLPISKSGGSTSTPTIPASIGVPKNKGEARLYATAWKNFNSSIIAGDTAENANYAQELAKDQQLEVENAKRASECNVCVVVPLPAPDPAPILEVLVDVVIPQIDGADDEELSDGDRAAIDMMQNQSSENLNRHFRNSSKRWSYSLYLKERALYYDHPQIKCPEAAAPQAEAGPPSLAPFVPSGPGPTPPEQVFKLDNPQNNDQTGQSSLIPPGPQQGAGQGEPPAQPTPPDQEPTG